MEGFCEVIVMIIPLNFFSQESPPSFGSGRAKKSGQETMERGQM